MSGQFSSVSAALPLCDFPLRALLPLTRFSSRPAPFSANVNSPVRLSSVCNGRAPYSGD